MPVLTFHITDQEAKAIAEFEQEQNRIAVEQQRKIFNNPAYMMKACWEMGFPYTGAIGGVLTYSFTDTSIGHVCTVKHNYTEAVKDVTDYGAW